MPTMFASQARSRLCWLVNPLEDAEEPHRSFVAGGGCGRYYRHPFYRIRIFNGDKIGIRARSRYSNLLILLFISLNFAPLTSSLRDVPRKLATRECYCTRPERLEIIFRRSPEVGSERQLVSWFLCNAIN